MHFPAGRREQGRYNQLTKGAETYYIRKHFRFGYPSPFVRYEIQTTSVSFISLQTAADGLYECSLRRKDGEGKTATCASRQATDDPPSSFMAVNYREEELHGRA